MEPKGRKSGFKSERSENNKVGRFVTSNFADVGDKKLILEVHKPEELPGVVVSESGVVEPLPELVKLEGPRESSTTARSPPSRKPG
jgi:hypothetical protein